ncbi:MAG: uroporphyrinogen-III synthase [Verrucomicrobiaceae bacterium]|nr:uroporphyrinogen-III synthase [Verrucomicrobiaceae bacterium]
MQLAGKRILITRPAGRADDLCAAVSALHGIPVHIPLLDVAPLDSYEDVAIRTKTAAQIAALAQYQRVIAISVNAVHYGMQWISAQHVPASLPRTINWYGIGAATIAEFANFKISARGGSAAMSSEALLALPELNAVAGENILILRGIGGRETLAAVLRERGANVEYAECYRRIAPQLDAAQQQQLQSTSFAAVCVNSAETLRNLTQIATAHALAQLQRSALIVPSARVAEEAGTLGFLRVKTAANASTAATLQALGELEPD